MKNRPEYGSPYDRGSSDAFSSRPFLPHKYVGGTLTGTRAEALSQIEIDEYTKGFNSETCRWTDFNKGKPPAVA
jgi:hypothetical protein